MYIVCAYREYIVCIERVYIYYGYLKDNNLKEGKKLESFYAS